ncbi:MAG: transcriptional regulator, partial [Rikenellaceae bacterium]|nr:transcriptional regulator [Rikenellaceae bacterium]
EKMAAITKQGGVLVTFSIKGVVKQALREAGFEVKRLPGACGKHHMLRALKL